MIRSISLDWTTISFGLLKSLSLVQSSLKLGFNKGKYDSLNILDSELGTCRSVIKWRHKLTVGKKKKTIDKAVLNIFYILDK